MKSKKMAAIARRKYRKYRQHQKKMQNKAAKQSKTKSISLHRGIKRSARAKWRQLEISGEMAKSHRMASGSERQSGNEAKYRK